MGAEGSSGFVAGALVAEEARREPRLKAHVFILQGRRRPSSLMSPGRAPAPWTRRGERASPGELGKCGSACTRARRGGEVGNGATGELGRLS